MRWLVTGAGGQLGSHLARVLEGSDDVICLARRQLDITRSADVNEAVDALRPDVVLNAAAYTAVDAAENDEPAALAINRDGPANLATALATRSGRLIHVSTDYVFRGDAHHPYEPDDPTGPRTAYGRTKLAGERAVRQVLPDRSVIVRTAWVYGGPGPNFVDTMRRLAAGSEPVRVVDDQIGSPTFVADLAAALVTLGRRETGARTLHYANSGQASWADLARETFRLVGEDPGRVVCVGSADFPRPARRPTWSVLSTAAWSALHLPAPRPWPEALRDHLAC